MMTIKLIFTLLSFILFVSCQSYTQENQKIRNEIYNGRLAEATTELDKSSIADEGKNYALYGMEKGMLLYLQNKYSDAIKNWINSDKKIDNLYTTSISKSTASFIINDSMSDYSGEAHERLLLPIFSSIAFFADNDQNNSLVMIRRAYDVKKEFEANNENSNSIKYNIFSHYFSGIVYESKNEWDNAIIEYKNALNNVQFNKLQRSASKSIENIILKDLGRLAEYRNRKDILSEIKKINPNISWDNQNNFLQKGEIYFIYESGISPVKTPKDILFPTDKTIIKISFPEYIDIPYKNNYVNIYLDEKLAGRTIVMEDVGKMAKQALENRRIRDFAKISTRTIAKEAAARKLANENPLLGLLASIFNVATETADTRSWTTLPDTIQVFRTTILTNKVYKITIKPEYSPPLYYEIKLQPGEKKLIRFRTFN